MRIVWAITVPKGHRMPLNPDVDAAGNVAVTEPTKLSTGRYAPRYARVLKRGDTAGDDEWTTTSHHATCTEWKKRR